MKKEVTFGTEYRGSEVIAALRLAAAKAKSCRLDYLPRREYLKGRVVSEAFRNPRLIVGDVEIFIRAGEEDVLQGDALYSGIHLHVQSSGFDWSEMEQFERDLLEALRKGPVSGTERHAEKEESIEKRELSGEELDRIERGQMTILALVQGEYGERIVRNIGENGPKRFKTETMTLPEGLPVVVDDPSEFVSDPVPKADLLLALQENSNAAQLIAYIAKQADVRALIAPVDNGQWLPHGMRTQIERELSRLGIVCAFPRPFCTLDEVGDPVIDKFVEFFGKPILDVKVEKDTVTEVRVVRDTACGCGRFVAKELPGTKVRDAVERAGLIHHHYPCLCAMNVEDDLGDTLMHVSGLEMKKTVDKSLEPVRKKNASYIDPTQM